MLCCARQGMGVIDNMTEKSYCKVRKRNEEEIMHATLTSKGQITLPKNLRERLSLSAGDRVEFIFEEDQSVRLVPKHILVSHLKGMLPKPSKAVSLEEMENAVRTGAGAP
jgi:antitoxin PrlF